MEDGDDDDGDDNGQDGEDSCVLDPSSIRHSQPTELG